MAIDMANVPPEQTVYVDDRKLFVEVAGTLGLKAIHHTGYEQTHRAFQKLGLI
jgi:putative hydrolase of the HAD superfamily